MVRKSDRPCVYQVVWPDGVFKVGATRTGRYRTFLSRGGRIVRLDFFGDEIAAYEAEDVAHAEAQRLYYQAFRSKQESLPYLGSGGGWRECYRIDIPKEVTGG